MKKLYQLFIILTASLMLSSCSGKANDKPKYETKEQETVHNTVMEAFNSIKKLDLDSVNKYFSGDNSAQKLGISPIDEGTKVIAEKVDCKINNIKLNENKDKAVVDITVTGIDSAKIIYEIYTYKLFATEWGIISSTNSNKALEDANDLYLGIIKRNADNVKKTDISLNLNKENDKWVIVYDDKISAAMMGSSIPEDKIFDKTYENFKAVKENHQNLYEASSKSITLNEYWLQYLTEFKDNYMNKYIDEYPFKEAFPEK